MKQIDYRIKNGKVEVWYAEGGFTSSYFNSVDAMKRYYGAGHTFNRWTKRDYILNCMEW